MAQRHEQLQCKQLNSLDHSHSFPSQYLSMEDATPKELQSDEPESSGPSDTNEQGPDEPKKSKPKRTGRDTRLRSRLTTRQGLKEIKQQVPSWFTSLVLHVAVLLLLGFVTLPLSTPPELSLQAARIVEETLDIEEADLLEVDLDLEQETLDETIDQEFEAEPQVEVLTEALAADDITPLDSLAEVVDFGASISDLGTISASEGMSSSGLEGRASASKANMLRRGGGTKSSEKAVQEGLDWLARHQYPDGSWNFDHSQSECDGRCGNPGNATQARAGATGLALMTYLGAGHTQNDGRYKRVVYRGIYALGNLIKVDKNGGSFWDPQGQMYSHGIATMAICEAYAMTGEPALRAPAQAAIDYVCYAQDPSGGGWRYRPRQPGDTSVMGWQIGALKSGYLSNLSVPPSVVAKASGYLDTMMVDGGSRYLYDLDPKHDTDRPAVTAIGLLCRMYMGVQRNDKSLAAGIKALSKRGPSTSDAYYNYYAAQVLFHHTGGKGAVWKKWNDKLRTMLIESQVKAGHEAGSWSPAKSDYKSQKGGRLYTTALSTMTLEVYYRMLPIYRDKAVAGEFEFEE